MLFISPKNEYPRHYGDIMIAQKGWKIGDPIPNGWREVAMTQPPVAEGDFIVDELEPIEIDGVLSQNWVVRPMTPEEIELRDAPAKARQKMIDAGLTDLEINELIWSLR